MKHAKLIVGVSVCAIASVAVAETLRQKELHKYYQEQVDGHLKDTNEKCETTMAAGFEWSGFDSLPMKDNNYAFPPGQFGTECLDGITLLCRTNKDAKSVVKDKIKKLVIAYGGEGKRNVELSNGTLTYTIDPKAGTMKLCYDWVSNHL